MTQTTGSIRNRKRARSFSAGMDKLFYGEGWGITSLKESIRNSNNQKF